MTYHLRSFGSALPTDPAPTMSPLQGAINAIQAAVLTAGPAAIDLAIQRVAQLPLQCPAQQAPKDAIVAALMTFKANPTPAGMSGFDSLLSAYALACGAPGGGLPGGGGGGGTQPATAAADSTSLIVVGVLGVGVGILLLMALGKKK